MADILDRIIANKKIEVRELKKKVTERALEKAIENGAYARRSLANSISSTPGLIAEFKRASPSKGKINEHAKVETIVHGYDLHGALGISVLTDEKYFGAKTEDFKQAREVTTKPILRKEFIVDEYQLLESKDMGADVVLLIASILSKQDVKHFTELAHSLQLEVLLELHDRSELFKITGLEDILGVNNRDLKTFEVDVNNSIVVRKELGNPNIPMVSESGISNARQVNKLLNAGFQGFLMGEYFMRQNNPVEAFITFKREMLQLI